MLLLISCKTPASISTGETANNQEQFWNALKENCGKAFAGTVITAPENDTVFKDKRLVMHVRSCENGRIKIPFIVGQNFSRTWVFTKSSQSISLKHDHRHHDGKEDSITQYGGFTTNNGSATTQFFPADQFTVELLPAAAGNVWWVELVPGKYFTYNLRRLGTDRLFSIRFDLSIPIPDPGPPWGWHLQ